MNCGQGYGVAGEWNAQDSEQDNQDFFIKCTSLCE